MLLLKYCSPTVEEQAKSGLFQLTQGCFHCGIVADLWKLSSFVLLKNFQGINREYTLELLSLCKMSLPGLFPVGIGSRRHPYENEDHHGSGRHSFPGFLSLNSRTSPERVRSEPGLVGSE